MKRRNFLKILGGGLAALVVPVVALKAKTVNASEQLAREMLRKAKPILVLRKYGKPKALPKAGGTIKFRRPSPYIMTTVDCDSGIPKKPFKPVEYKEVTYGQDEEFDSEQEMVDRIARREVTDKLLDLASKGFIGGFK